MPVGILYILAFTVTLTGKFIAHFAELDRSLEVKVSCSLCKNYTYFFQRKNTCYFAMVLNVVVNPTGCQEACSEHLAQPALEQSCSLHCGNQRSIYN